MSKGGSKALSVQFPFSLAAIKYFILLSSRLLLPSTWFPSLLQERCSKRTERKPCMARYGSISFMRSTRNTSTSGVVADAW